MFFLPWDSGETRCVRDGDRSTVRTKDRGTVDIISFSSILFFASVSLACFECFGCFTLNVASVLSRCFRSISGVANSVFQMQVSYVSSAFRSMLKMLHLDVSKVDRVLHPCLCFSASSPSPRCLSLLLAPTKHMWPLSLF